MRAVRVWFRSLPEKWRILRERAQEYLSFAQRLKRVNDELAQEKAVHLSTRQKNHEMARDLEAKELALRLRQKDPLFVARRLNEEAQLIFEGQASGGMVQLYEIKSWLGEYRAARRQRLMEDSN